MPERPLPPHPSRSVPRGPRTTGDETGVGVYGRVAASSNSGVAEDTVFPFVSWS